MAVDDDNKADNKLATALGDVYFVSCVIKPRKHSHFFPPHPKIKSRIWAKKQHRRVVSRRRRVDTQKEGWTPLHARFDYSKIINLSYILSLVVAVYLINWLQYRARLMTVVRVYGSREREKQADRRQRLISSSPKWSGTTTQWTIRCGRQHMTVARQQQQNVQQSLTYYDKSTSFYEWIIPRQTTDEDKHHWLHANVIQTRNYMYKNISPFTPKLDKKSLPSGFKQPKQRETERERTTLKKLAFIPCDRRRFTNSLVVKAEATLVIGRRRECVTLPLILDLDSNMVESVSQSVDSLGPARASEMEWCKLSWFSQQLVVVVFVSYSLCVLSFVFLHDLVWTGHSTLHIRIWYIRYWRTLTMRRARALCVRRRNTEHGRGSCSTVMRGREVGWWRERTRTKNEDEGMKNTRMKWRKETKKTWTTS